MSPARAAIPAALRPAPRRIFERVRAFAHHGAPLALALGLALASAGCASEFTGRKATLTYTEDARAAYEEAMRAFRAKEWEDARALFAEVKRLFAYSRYARLAELRLADIEFEQEKYSDAITAYRDFVQNHRNDPDAEYARYRLTKALFLDIDDTILLPPQEERDQATTIDAYKELRTFNREFPKSRYRDDVRYMIEVVTGRLVRHELYIARFYLRQDNFDATIARVDFALKVYPESTLIPEAMVLKGETLMKMRRWDDARAVLEQVVQKGGPFAKPAQNFLEEIGDKKGAGPPPPGGGGSGGGGGKGSPVRAVGIPLQQPGSGAGPQPGNNGSQR